MALYIHTQPTNLYVMNDKGEQKDVFELVYEFRGIKLEKVYQGNDLILSEKDKALILEVSLEWIEASRNVGE